MFPIDTVWHPPGFNFGNYVYYVKSSVYGKAQFEIVDFKVQ